MSEYRIKNIQPYEGNSVIIDMKDTRVSIATDGKNAIECLESALRYLKGKETQPSSEVNETIESHDGKGVVINRTIHLNVDGVMEYKTLTDKLIKELAVKMRNDQYKRGCRS